LQTFQYDSARLAPNLYTCMLSTDDTRQNF
jgi:hypothetical protein